MAIDSTSGLYSMDKADPPTWQKQWKQVDDVPNYGGGQGSVFCVRDVEGTIGALKVMLPEHRDKHERRRRMAREVLALKKAAGSQVPRVLDDNAEQVNDLSVPLYFVEEWIDGQTLAKASEGKPRSLEESLVLTRRLGEIVNHCHARGVYHRDIKPENILLDSDGAPVLVDFGIAWVDPQFRDVDDKRTAVGQEFGNRFLRLPELSAGQTKDDPRADVAFLVGILFFLLTGKRPRGLVVDNTGRPPHEAWENQFPKETQQDPRYQTRLKGLFRVGFQVAPDLRFQSAEELIAAIDEILNPESPSVSVYEKQVAEFDEVTGSIAVQQRAAIEAGMMDASQKLETALRERAEKKDLQPVSNAGGPRQIGDGLTVVFPLQIYRKGFQVPDANLTHHIWRDTENPAFLNAAYYVDDDIPDSHVYYRGHAADVDRLQEETMAHVDKIFGAALALLTERLKAY